MDADRHQSHGDKGSGSPPMVWDFFPNPSNGLAFYRGDFYYTLCLVLNKMNYTEYRLNHVGCLKDPIYSHYFQETWICISIQEIQNSCITHHYYFIWMLLHSLKYHESWYDSFSPVSNHGAIYILPPSPLSSMRGSAYWHFNKSLAEDPYYRNSFKLLW